MSIKDKAVALIGTLHLKDAEDNLMYLSDTNGKDDQSKPIQIVLYSPGSKEFAKADAKKQNYIMELMKTRRKAKLTAEEVSMLEATFNADCTHSFVNIEYPDPDKKGEMLTGRELHEAVYADREIGFISDQVKSHLSDWANFIKKSTKG